ncbi:hypothetical protein PF001_g32607, partial [Phytophthora fragariae]
MRGHSHSPWTVRRTASSLHVSNALFAPSSAGPLHVAVSVDEGCDLQPPCPSLRSIGVGCLFLEPHVHTTATSKTTCKTTTCKIMELFALFMRTWGLYLS